MRLSGSFHTKPTVTSTTSEGKQILCSPPVTEDKWQEKEYFSLCLFTVSLAHLVQLFLLLLLQLFEFFPQERAKPMSDT